MSLSSYHICIEGTIGVGKTSLVNLLAKEMDAKTVLEKFEDNPFLKDFYSDRTRYAMQTQLFFLLSRYKAARTTTDGYVYQIYYFRLYV